MRRDTPCPPPDLQRRCCIFRFNCGQAPIDGGGRWWNLVDAWSGCSKGGRHRLLEEDVARSWTREEQDEVPSRKRRWSKKTCRRVCCRSCCCLPELLSKLLPPRAPPQSAASSSCSPICCRPHSRQEMTARCME